MTDDKEKFEDIGPHKDWRVKFGNDIPCVVIAKGTIQLNDKIKCDNAYWVEDLTIICWVFHN